MNTDDEDIRRSGLVMARTEEFQAREQHDRETAALIGKALELRGTRQAPPTRLDLDDLERKARAATPHYWRWGREEGTNPRGLYVLGRGAQALPILQLDAESFSLTLAANTEHIEANSPPVVLALIARIRELEGERDRLAPRAKAADVLEVEMVKLLPLADAAEHIRNATLEPIARAATAFVDRQGVFVAGGGLAEAADFCGDLFADLVRAVEGAGR